MAAVMSRGRTNPFSKHLGIEVNDNITWQGWEPGGEYTKNIILKNVQVKTQKLKYKGPSTRFFTTLYPKPIVLSSGTSFTLPVTFRPLEKDQYEDYIEFETNDGEFKIPMKAVLPKPDISIPGALDFIMCAVKDSNHLNFEVRNTSELMTTFQWQLTEPFTFMPPSGTLAPGTSCLIKATFTPTEAKVYEAIAVCKYSHNPDNVLVKSMKIEGIGKFPHLVVRTGGQRDETVLAPELPLGQVQVDFSAVPIQTTKTKWIELHNLSPVNAPYQVIQPSSVANVDTVFSCSQYHGVVDAESYVKLKISYSPHTPDQHSVDYFEVVALGATNCSVVNCSGTGKGPLVSLDTPCLDFAVVESGKQIARTFKMINTSTVSAAFQFLIDCSQSVFKINTTCGLIPGGETLTIIMHFTPTKPINYYRRLVCLVQNQDPLFIDLIGTCHTEQVKPAPLRKKHLERYHLHVSRGLSRIPPEQLNNMVQENKLQLDEQGAVLPAEGVVGDKCMSQSELSALEELFNDSTFADTTQVVPHVSLDSNTMDFGRILDDKAVEQKTVNITNHTKGKITCSWMKDTKCIFSVSPDECDILPLKTASFRVTFRPDAANQFFNAELECYASYKSMRDYRLVEDKTFCPPWCMTLNTSGHTFVMGTETFIPRFEWDATKMVFPAVTNGEMSYRTLLLTNKGSNPIHFAFDPDPDRIFSCLPSKGLLTDQYQLVVFRMAPPEPQVFKRTIKCRFNDADKFTQELALIGSAETPRVQLEGEGTVYFKPTCIGTTSTRSMTVKNTSRIPLWFRWKVAGAFENVLSITPADGVIMPNETKIQTLSFSPLDATKYLIKAKLFVSSWQGEGQNGPSAQEYKYLVRVIGEGAVGELLCVEPSIDFGDIVVGSSSSKDLTIHNNSDCSLHYRLTIDQDVQGPYDDEGAERDIMTMELSNSDGVIAARTSTKITSTVFPARRVTYDYTINYELLSTTDGGQKLLTRTQTPLVQLQCQGVYPTLSVSDIRGLGSNKGCSKVQMWSLFSLDSFNECLDSDPSAPELMYVAATRHSTKRRVPVYTRAIMDFNFGSAPLDSEPATVHLNLENTGSVAAEWAFLYPSDLQLELEYWAETGEYDADELHEMQVMDSKLFTVEPRKGTLVPGSRQTITLTYRHMYTGLNKLPVIFKVTRGREILLNFIGVTVDPEAYYVHFASTKHMFEPVPVGGNSPPVQIYELHNGGAKTVNYELDVEPLGQIQAQNYGCRVLDCLNPSGEIPPGCTALIHWVFAPLEAKTYVVDIPIRIIGGDTVLVTFTGVGYDQRIMGETMAFKDTAAATVPSKQIVNVKQQLPYLSVERMPFGNVPLYSVSRQVFFVTNSSPDHVISFRWIIEGTPAEQVAMIEPDHGYLQPGQTKLLKISFFSCGAPSLYDMDILCEVVDETEMADFNQRLIKWTNDQEERQYTFTITEADVKQDRPRSGPRLKSLASTDHSHSKSEGDLRRYQALPPIGRQENTATKKRKTKPAASDRSTPLQPSPPESFWLHLGVTARTHSIAEFHKNFPSDINNFIIDQRYVVSEDARKDAVDLTALTTCTSAEMNVITDVMSVILRGLLDDGSFHSSLADLANEPVPYFRQLCETPYMYDHTPSRPSSAGSVRSETGQEYEDDIDQPPVSHGRQESPPAPFYDDRASSKTHEIVQRSGSSLSAVDHLRDADLDPEWKATQRNKARSLPEFESFLEAIVENTLLNVLTEASHSEVNLTARPRVIALPPSRLNKASR